MVNTFTKEDKRAEDQAEIASLTSGSCVRVLLFSGSLVGKGCTGVTRGGGSGCGFPSDGASRTRRESLVAPGGAGGTSLFFGYEVFVVEGGQAFHRREDLTLMTHAAVLCVGLLHLADSDAVAATGQ